MTLHGPIRPDDTFLFDDGLPCIRREGRLYYLADVQPRVLEACRRFGVSFEQLVDKLGMQRPALVLILKGYDPVPAPLKDMLDRLVIQAATLQDSSSAESPADSPAEPTAAASKVTIMSVPVPEAPTAESVADPMGDAAVTAAAEEVVIPDVVSVGQLASPDVVLPTIPDFSPGLPAFTPGLRRTTQHSRPRRSAGKEGQFLLT